MDVGIDSRVRLLLICLCVVMLVTAVGFGFDHLLMKEGVRRYDILLTSNGLTGIVAGFLFFTLSNQERERRKRMQLQLRTIAEMNHHIRNALQVITYAASSEGHAGSVDLIRNSVERIEWTLREVLSGEGTASEAVPAHEKPQETTRVR